MADTKNTTDPVAELGREMSLICNALHAIDVKANSG